MNSIQYKIKSSQDQFDDRNLNTVFPNRERINNMIRQKETTKKYCTLSQDFFTTNSTVPSNQYHSMNQQEYDSPVKVNKLIESLASTQLKSNKGIYRTPQYYTSRKYEQKVERQQDMLKNNLLKGTVQEGQEKSRYLQDNNNVASVNEQANQAIQFNRLFKVNQTFVEQQNLNTKRLQDRQFILNNNNENKISPPQIAKTLTPSQQSPLKKSRKQFSSTQILNPSFLKVNSNLMQFKIKNQEQNDTLKTNVIPNSNNQLYKTMNELNLSMNRERGQASNGIKSLSAIPQSYSLESTRINNQLNNYFQGNQFRASDTESIKNAGIMRNFDQISSTRSSQQTQFNNRIDTAQRKTRQNSCINILERGQKYQLPQSLNLLGNSFDDSINNLTEANNNDPCKIKSLQNIDFLIEKIKSNNTPYEGDNASLKISPKKQSSKKLLFQQSSLNYLDGYLSQSKLYRESVNQREDSNGGATSYQTSNNKRKIPTQSMQNIINRCFVQQTNKSHTSFADEQSFVSKESPLKKMHPKKNNLFQFSLNFKLEPNLSNQIGGSMNRIDIDQFENKSNFLSSPQTERLGQQNQLRKGSRLLLKQGTRKESSSSSTNAISGKTTKPESMLSSPQMNFKENALLSAFETCFGNINKYNAFIDELQESYLKEQKQNKFEFIKNFSLRFNDSPIKDFITLSIGAPIKESVEEVSQKIKQQFKVLGINYWELKEIKRIIFKFISQGTSVFEEDKNILITSIERIEEELFKWRIYDELERYTVGDMVSKIHEEIENDPVSQQILHHLPFMNNQEYFEQLLTIAFTWKSFTQYEDIIKQNLAPLNWTYADLMCIKLCVYKIFTKRFKFSQSSMVTFFDIIERMRYVATKEPDFFQRLKEKDNDYNNFFGNINRQCLSYLLAQQSSSKGPQGAQQGIVNQHQYFSQSAQIQALQNNSWMETYIPKFIQNIFFGSLEVSLFDLIKNDKYEKIISATSFASIKKIILHQLDFYVCPVDYLCEIKKKLRLLKIQLGLKASFNQELYEYFQSCQNQTLKQLSLKESQKYFTKCVVEACLQNQTFNKQNTLGKSENLQIFALSLINFIFDIMCDKNFPIFLSVYDCFAFSKVFGVPSFYFEEFSYVLKTVITKQIKNQEFSQKLIRKTEKTMAVIVSVISEFD